MDRPGMLQTWDAWHLKKSDKSPVGSLKTISKIVFLIGPHHMAVSENKVPPIPIDYDHTYIILFR